jgi:hypothetical protein
MLSKWMVLFLLLILTGCASIGPRQIGLDRNRYNDMIQETDDQQLLTDIVRLRYLQPLSFLKVGGVTASYTMTPFNTQANNGLLGYTRSTVAGVATTTRELNFTPSFGYSDSPTISYTPVQGTDFASSIMTPIQLQALQLFAYGGPNDPTFLLRLVFQSIDSVDNASAASTAKAYAIPKYERYYHFMFLMKNFFQRENCILMPAQIKGNYALAIHCFDRRADRVVKDIFHAPQGDEDILVTQTYVPHAPKNVFFIQTRSVNGILAYLSHAVEVPDSDVVAGYVPVLRYPDGTPFDWTPLTQGLFKVYWSNSEPMDAFVKVIVHNHWFYIKDSDVDSKATFGFVNRLITLTAAQQVSTTGPLLTIPAR